MVWLALIVGSIIIAALAYYAGSLLAQLRRQRQIRDTAIGKRNSNLFESIETIALAMQQEQCPLSEGSLRLTVLLDHLALPGDKTYEQDYPAIHDMYHRIKHMPTHEARKQHPKKDIREMDREREGYEVELAEPIQKDISALLVWVRRQRAG
ncbi:DUF2489 domain-containing protein [Aliidiomarina soli]|uniref:DUF2489 domain-containing protein n=2 Tax=Aliidiomarina TaxID=1249554 RepID=A0A432WIP7_9GAMM|nr:DUF2489 domain-containing protein [Aliidiomarina soli]RUO33702.1 DUF2489 domain-containing protein [Aliidiomarina soli]